MEAILAQVEQCDVLGDALSRAFVTDPVCCYIFRTREARLRKMRWIFTRWLRVMIKRNHVYTTPELNGAVLWHAPDCGYNVGIGEEIRAGFLSAAIRLNPCEQVRGLITHLDATARMKRFVKEPHWIIDTLGVAPEHHRKGIARILLTPVLQKADADGIPCFVNTHSSGNVHFYERFGFSLFHDSPMPCTDITVYSLRRAPVAR